MLLPKKTNRYTQSACETRVECLKWENTQNRLIYDEVGPYDHVQATKNILIFPSPMLKTPFLFFLINFGILSFLVKSFCVSIL